MNLFNFLAVFIFILIDQISKWAVRTYWPNLILRNSGSAFGIISKSDAALILSTVTILIFLLILNRSKLRPNSFSTVLILGGAFSNLLDRLWHGAILDFIKISYFSTFNLADVFIFGGVIIYAYQIFRHK